MFVSPSNRFDLPAMPLQRNHLLQNRCARPPPPPGTLQEENTGRPAILTSKPPCGSADLRFACGFFATGGSFLFTSLRDPFATPKNGPLDSVSLIATSRTWMKARRMTSLAMIIKMSSK